MHRLYGRFCEQTLRLIFTSTCCVRDRYKVRVYQTCSARFWKYFLPMHHHPVNAIDAALRSAKLTFMSKHDPDWKDFPTTRRTLLTKMGKVDNFWSSVLHTATIDVSRVRLSKPLASGTRTVTFEFIDPVWAWLMAASRLPPSDLHWKPVAQNLQRAVYGGGIQYGQCFLEAYKSCPQGSYPMMVALHWDGTSGAGLSAAPICIGIANSNSCSADTQFCIGYMPEVPDMARPGFSNHKDGTSMKFYLRQQCCAAILNVLEAAAETGVLCQLDNRTGASVKRLLFPRLVAMNIDQPEAQLFFGMKNKTSCSKCKWRKGYSAFRVGGVTSGSTVRRLYQHAEGRSTVAKKCREKLQRWGFNPTRKCCLLSPNVDKLFVRLPGKDEVFPGLDCRDRMHSIFIFFHRVIVEALNSITAITPARKRIFDQRLHILCVNKYFRNSDGSVFRKQKSIFETADMTAADKVCMLFLMPHVIGHQGDHLIPELLLEPVLAAIAHAQLIIIAVSGRRQYTKIELEAIFNRGYLIIFGALERIRTHDYNHRCLTYYNDPANCPRPKRTKLQTREWTGFITPNTDTSDTGDDQKIEGLGFYSHGNHCLQHQHWVLQVTTAGGFNVHCTQASEAKHKVVMHVASKRVLHRDVQTTKSGMLRYLCWCTVFDGMNEFVTTGGAIPALRSLASGVRLPISCLSNQHKFSSVAFQRIVVHREARIVTVELLDLLCDQFGLRRCLRSYDKLSKLRYVIGQKFVRTDGSVLWATDTKFSSGGTHKKRRDFLFVKGTETSDVNTGRRDALCCEAVAFLKVSGMTAAELNVLPCLRSDVHDDSINFVLARYLEPHPTAVERDSLHRPVCPGPLHINHCLWRYARAARVRAALIDSSGRTTIAFQTQRRIFGQTIQEQSELIEKEKFAYFTLLTPSNILHRVNLSPIFVPGTSKLDLGTWLQTVTVV